MVGGIPDFRLQPDRFLSIEADRAKGLAVAQSAQTYADALQVYYGMTHDLPPWRAQRYVESKLADLRLGQQTWDSIALPQPPPGSAVLDIGCGAGGLAIAAQRRYQVVALDAAFRWLVIARMQAREVSADVTWVCANAESLPFPDSAFSLVTSIDVVEHVAEPVRLVAESRRVLKPNANFWLESNNAHSWLPEPHVRLPLAGWLPRRWQIAYVRRLRGMEYSRTRLWTPAQVRRIAEAGGFHQVQLRPAFLRTVASGPLVRLAHAIHRPLSTLRIYTTISPRLAVTCRVGESGATECSPDS